MLPRTLETEAMDTLAEAVDYDSMDHREVNRIFVADLLAARRGEKGDRPHLPERPEGCFAQMGPVPFCEGWILDLGTGTAQIPVELCRQDPSAKVLAIDAAEHMLRLARSNIEQAGLADRIRVQRVDAKRLPYADGSFATVASNSIVHHIPDPSQVLGEAWRVLAPGGLIFIRDLFRPDDEAAVEHLVATYAAGASGHQRQMLADSFHAALTVKEIRQIVMPLGVAPETVRATSDRHWTWSARKD